MPRRRHRNHTWLTPLRLIPGGSPIRDVIDRPYQSRWYHLDELKAGDDVTVTLTDCAVDYTLLGFTDIREKADQILGLRNTRGSVDADDMDSDDMDSDDMDSDDMDSDDMDSEDMDSDDMDSDDMDSDDMDSDDMDSDDMDSGLYERYADVYGSAQRHALRSASVTPGPADEQIHMTARAGGGRLYFRVRGHHGAYARREPFKISASVAREDACVDADLAARWSKPVALEKRTALILTRTKRTSLKIADHAKFNATLGSLANAVNGLVYDLDRDHTLAELYAAWTQRPTCVAQANAIVESIRGIVEDIAKTGALRYVVIVGGDDVVPFARVEDRAEISREWKWGGPYKPDMPLGAALTYGFYLSDDPYTRPGALDPRGKNLRAPERAVGRLVETADDITAYIEKFFLRSGRQGLTIRRALTTGYTFVADLADDIFKVLDAASVKVDKSLIRNDWIADELAERISGQPPQGQPRDPNWQKSDLIAAQGHYSANTLVPARDGTARLRPDDPSIAQSDLMGVIWMTIGCHSGHNILDLETREAYTRHGAGRSDSWAEWLLRRGATLIGGTGYQYGESVLTENSERLYWYLAQEIAAAKAIGIGDALVAAKTRYLRGLLKIRGIDQKLLDVAILYGLPMLQVGVPQPQQPPPVQVPKEKRLETDESGVANEDVAISGYLLARQTVGDEAYWTADDNRVAGALGPVLPAATRHIAVAGLVPVGVLWTGGHYSEVAEIPLIARPVTEVSPRKPKYRSRAFLPVRPFRISRQSPHTLVFAPMQVNSGAGRSRLWDRARFKVFYSNGAHATAIHDSPALEDPVLTPVAGGVDVSVDVRHYAAADESVQVLAGYLDGSELRVVPLDGAVSSWGDGNGWVRRVSGHIPFHAAALRVFFQAAGANGRVSSLTNGGRFFAVDTPGTPRETHLSLVAQAIAGYRDVITVEADLSLAASGDPVNDVEVLFRLGASRIWATTKAGIATAKLTVATRPRDSTYLVVASFPGMENAAASAASLPLTVTRAVTALTNGVRTIESRRRVAVSKLVHAVRGTGMGERPVTILNGTDEYVVYTDPDGSLALESADIGSPSRGDHELKLVFEGDERYLPVSDTIKITVT